MVQDARPGKLLVNSVSYQSLRTTFAQPTTIARDAKIAVEYFFNSKGEIQPVIYNLTSEILVVDQTKSFLIRPDGASLSYYDPTVYATTNGELNASTNGSSFNLGGITSALGIGGVLGTLASATNINSSNTTGLLRQNTVTITDQPRVSIGPKGSIAMSKAYTIEGIGFNSHVDNDIIDISPEQAKVKFSVCISYSFDDGSTFEKLITDFYVSSHISVPVSNRKVSNAFYKIYKLKPDALAENMYMFTIPNNIKTETTDVMGDFLTHTDIYDSYLQGSLIDFQ